MNVNKLENQLVRINYFIILLISVANYKCYCLLNLIKELSPRMKFYIFQFTNNKIYLYYDFKTINRSINI